jgi:hypothetical protein
MLDGLLVIIDSSIRILLFGIIELISAFTGYSESEGEDKFSRTHRVLRARQLGLRLPSYATYLEWLRHYKKELIAEKV